MKNDIPLCGVSEIVCLSMITSTGSIQLTKKPRRVLTFNVFESPVLFTNACLVRLSERNSIHSSMGTPQVNRSLMS